MQEIGLIVSTGRTGTQFFEHFINSYCTNALCLHEPKPSRRFKFYSNLYLQKKISASFIATQFVKSRKKIIQKASNKKYIESNNFLFGCLFPIAQGGINTKVLHIIREPKSYIISHLKHGFWNGHKRFFAKYVPYWLEKLDLTEPDKNNPVRILAKRWYFVNNSIANQHNSNNYLTLRFEDIFSSDKRIATENLTKAIHFFGLELNKNVNLEKILNEKQNVGKKKIINHTLLNKDKAFIEETCSELIHKFNY